MIKLSNSRQEATIQDWPMGRKRLTAVFTVQSPDKGAGRGKQRVARQLGSYKPKYTTYYLRTRIVDGDDGRTYIAAYTEYNQAVLIPGTLKSVEYYYPKSPEFFEIVSKVFSEEEISEMIKSFESNGVEYYVGCDDHLTSCDDDGFCNKCGQQEGGAY
jgi:hypothetical protein